MTLSGSIRMFFDVSVIGPFATDVSNVARDSTAMPQAVDAPGPAVKLMPPAPVAVIVAPGAMETLPSEVTSKLAAVDVNTDIVVLGLFAAATAGPLGTANCNCQLRSLNTSRPFAPRTSSATNLMTEVSSRSPMPTDPCTSSVSHLPVTSIPAAAPSVTSPIRAIRVTSF